MKEYHLDCNKFSNYLKVDDNDIILETAPIFKKFIGQPLSNLTFWVQKKFGYCILKEINKEN